MKIFDREMEYYLRIEPELNRQTISEVMEDSPVDRFIGASRRSGKNAMLQFIYSLQNLPDDAEIIKRKQAMKEILDRICLKK
jgi:hypothetical protein